MGGNSVDRRFFLTLTATTAMGLTLSPTRVFALETATSPEMNALSAYMSAAGVRALPAEVTEHAKHHLLDTLASMISGSELAPGQAAQRYIRSYSGRGAATIAGTTLTASPVDAALANGLMAQADETDDSHNASRSHPGCADVPAALAVGEELGIDGARFLRAVTLGYDVGTRVVMAMNGAAFSYESSLATHSIAGTFGASAAASCVAGLDARQMRWALDYASQQSVGHRRLAARHRPHREVVCFRRHAGTQRRHLGARRQIGLERCRRHLLGRRQLLSLHTRRRRNKGLVEKLGERYEIVQTDIKKWTVGSPIQALDAIEAIRAKRPFVADSVQRYRAPGSLHCSSRGQPRHPRHLPAAHGSCDAARQNRLASPRTTRRVCRMQTRCGSARK
jgi:2-methylcitrate dehydratase PrpD